MSESNGLKEKLGNESLSFKIASGHEIERLIPLVDALDQLDGLFSEGDGLDEVVRQVTLGEDVHFSFNLLSKLFSADPNKIKNLREMQDDMINIMNVEVMNVASYISASISGIGQSIEKAQTGNISDPKIMRAIDRFQLKLNLMPDYIDEASNQLEVFMNLKPGLEKLDMWKGVKSCFQGREEKKVVFVEGKEIITSMGIKGIKPSLNLVNEILNIDVNSKYLLGLEEASKLKKGTVDSVKGGVMMLSYNIDQL